MVKHLVLSGGGQTIFNYLGIFQELFDEKHIESTRELAQHLFGLVRKYD